MTFRVVLCLWLLSLANANAAWTVNNSPVITDTGIDVKISEQRYTTIFYRLSDGTPHVTFGFAAPLDFFATPFVSYPAQIWDVNLSNGVSRVRTLAPGSPPVNPILSISNTLVLGTSDPGHMVVYDPVTGLTNYIKECSDRDYYSACNSSDGIVFFGTFGPEGNIESYDPATGLAKEWGAVDVDMDGSGYIYSIGADTNFVYCAVKPIAGTHFYLGIMERATTNMTLHWKGSATTAVTIDQATNGAWYCNQVTNGVSKYWHLTNNTLSIAVTPPTLKPWWRDSKNVNNDQTTWSSDEGWDVNMEFDVTSISGSIPNATLGYKQTNEVSYTGVVETNGWIVSAATINLLVPWTGSTLLWATRGYGPIGNFQPHGLSYMIGPYKGLSTYDLLHVSATEFYISGYHQSTLRWNPNAAWTKVPLLDDLTDPAYNPFTAYATGGKYHFYLTRGNNGRIFIGQHHERGSVGGELAWYDPVSGLKGSERTAFLSASDDVGDLKPAENGGKLVYTTVSSNIFVWDVATFTKLTNFTVRGGGEAPHKVVEYSHGKMFGVIGSNIVAFTTSGVQLYSNNLPATAWGSPLPSSRYAQRLTLGPDSHVWLCAGGYLYRINPESGSYTNVIRTTNNFNVVFHNYGSAYLYGDKKVLEISRLLQEEPSSRLSGSASLSGRASIGQ